jgi:hypothetical protein
MNAPKRWLDEGGGATPGERDLLRSGLAMDPPAGAQAAVWSAILAGLPAAGAAGGAAVKASAGAKAAVAAKAAGSGGAAVAVGGGILKSALIGAGCGVVVVATYSVVAPSPPDVRPPPPAVVPLAPEPARHPGGRAPVAPAPSADPSAAASAGAAADHRPDEPRAPATGTPEAPSPSGEAAAQDPGTTAGDESRLVGEARQALAGGDAAGALAKLDAVAARFPGGVLVLEREALTIEALYKSGRRSEATARAAAFLKANPDSTLARRVQPFAN